MQGLSSSASHSTITDMGSPTARLMSDVCPSKHPAVGIDDGLFSLYVHCAFVWIQTGLSAVLAVGQDDKDVMRERGG